MRKDQRKIEVYTAGGKVVFGTYSGNYTFDPVTAVNVANAMLHAAADMGAEVKFEVEKPKVSTMQHYAMMRRAEHIIRSMRDKPDDQIARQVVDSILAAVL